MNCQPVEFCCTTGFKCRAEGKTESLNKDKLSEGGGGPNGSCRIRGGTGAFTLAIEESPYDVGVTALDPFAVTGVGMRTGPVACVGTGT
jgi:hypothetical protein